MSGNDESKLMLGQIPPIPGDDWTSWIIGTLMAMLATLVGTAVTLARMIDGKYIKQVTSLELSIVEMRVEIKECQNDRLQLSIRVASLEANSDAVERNTKAVDRNTDRK